jgi:Tfp pilus assembly protein PilW
MQSKRPQSTVPPRRALRRALAEEGGYSLIELLVAIISGLVVCFALFAILIFSTRQTSRLTNYAQATQQGRLAMTKIVDALRSACVVSGFTPIVPSSGPNELKFVNAYSEAAVIPKEAFDQQKIVFNSAAGTLTKYTYPAVKEITWPNFEYSATASPTTGVLLARNVTESEAGGKKIPVFQYFGYNAESSESATAGLNTLEAAPLETPLNEARAQKAASVLITFNAGPNEGTTATGSLGRGVSAALRNQVTLAFTAPISNEEVVDAPCM